ncbi:MAG: hypothetical protein JST11_18285 [Acidobacteria bacterium]|nr:hypothetical protein [Acidobacteriota bacterium]
MKRRIFTSILFAPVVMAVCAAGLLAQNNQGGQGNQGGKQMDDQGEGQISVHSRTPVEGFAPAAGGTGALSPISNHGGPVLGSPNVYLIWYGNWNQSNGSDTPAGQSLVRSFLAGLSNSPYYQINTTYPGVSGFDNLNSKEYTDKGSQGTSLNDRSIKTIVTNALKSGALGSPDPNGLYFVLTSSNIAKSGFCSQYCGWHTYMSYSGTTIQYSFVGNANRCLNACAAQTVGPNGNAGVDGMLSVVAHELEETNTDPRLNAWYDSSGAENADKCAWTFGQNLKVAANGAYYNMTLNGLNFLIQRNLAATDNKCYVNWATKAQ